MDSEGSVKLTELLRNPDDLDKILALKSEFTRKKTGVDSQLRLGLQEQLSVTQSGMGSITTGQRTTDLIKAEMQKIDKLCAEAQNMIRDFPHINTVAQTHRNFAQVEDMRRSIEEFDARLEAVDEMLREDDLELESQNNLLTIHFELSKLRDIKADVMNQVQEAGEAGEELVNNLPLHKGTTLSGYFEKLSEVVDIFDDHVGQACMCLLDLLIRGNDGLITRLALVIHEEEKNDRKARALQDAQQEYKELASRFKSITTGKREIRGYKEKFLQAIEIKCAVQFDETNEKFEEEPEKLDKQTRWFFNDLNAVKEGMVRLMPKRWKIFQTYVAIYHKQMHDWLIARIEDPNLRPPQLLAIVNWSDKYYHKTQKLGIPPDWLKPHVIDDRAGDMVREYRSLIIKAVDEWMDRMAKTDTQFFMSRDENATDNDENGYFRTKTLADMWRMLREQLEVAKSSERPDIVEGVVDAMFRALTSRQRMWEQLATSELQRYSDPNVSNEGIQTLQDWLIAIANDQIACIDDGDGEEDSLGYLTRFSNSILPLVPSEYTSKAFSQIEMLKEGYIDLSTHCLTVFAKLIITVDFRPLTAEFFSKDWYSKKGMAQAISTFDDYLNDYSLVLHPSLRDILAETLSDELLIAYLSCIRNKGVKVRRSDVPTFEQKVRDDVESVFNFFGSGNFDGFDAIRNTWRVVEMFVNLLAVGKGEIPEVYAAFKGEWWDLGMGWVEGCLRARDDFDRSLLNAVKGRAAEVEVKRGVDTIMGKVK
ncbi:exocyst complex component Sec6 [Tothia fuscella]|uniref:Exocyst complex component Sec6 n=1 Tax=Tothia fuscella TaxID=1048955 RepID=A0A9P4NIC4_9PEZI|nr:exocyst complex component Sec6 [Tothia fuscella]